MPAKLTLEQERKMLADIRTWQTVSAAEYERHLTKKLGVALTDQVRAASAEAEATLPTYLGVASFEFAGEARGDELLPMLTAGILRCTYGSACPHASRGDRPLFAFLAARVISCRDCLPRYETEVEFADARNQAGKDRLCDLCLEEPDDNFFIPISTSFGPAVVFGDMCEACKTRADVQQK